MDRVNIDRVAGRKERKRKFRMKCGSEVAIAMEQYKQLKNTTDKSGEKRLTTGGRYNI